MAQQTTDDDLTTEQIDNAYAVLEVLRENFSDAGMSDFADLVNEAHYLVQQYDESANWSKDYDMPEVGDVLNDPKSPSVYGDGRVEICDVLPDARAGGYVIEGRKRETVAARNPGEPGDAPLVRGRYVDGSDKVYTFPVTRLE